MKLLDLKLLLNPSNSLLGLEDLSEQTYQNYWQAKVMFRKVAQSREAVLRRLLIGNRAFSKGGKPTSLDGHERVEHYGRMIPPMLVVKLQELSHNVIEGNGVV